MVWESEDTGCYRARWSGRVKLLGATGQDGLGERSYWVLPGKMVWESEVTGC